MTQDELVALREVVLDALLSGPKELHRLVAVAKATPKRVTKMIGALITEKAIVRHGGQVPQYGLPGSIPDRAVRVKKWVNNAIVTPSAGTQGRGSWWIGKDRDGFKASSPFKE